jgi:nicotinamide-nucleotide amidase
MTVALLSIGTELLRGEALDTNAPWLAAELTHMGFAVAAIEAASSDRTSLGAALGRLGEAHDLLLATGGLGPTGDDLTAEVAAAAAGVALHCNEDALAAIRRRVEEQGGELLPGHRKQAWLPEGSTALLNPDGTATGFIVRIGHATAYFLPGAPGEMKRLFEEQVAPRIQPSATKDSFQIALHLYGLAEAEIDQRLEGIAARHPGVTLAYRADGPEVDVKVLGRGANYGEARERAQAAALDIRERLGELVYGEGDDTLAQVAARAVRNRGWRIASAESCTGGLIAQQLTGPQACDVFAGSAVIYDNSAKAIVLGVSEDTLRGHGAVSGEVAAEMAEGARRVFDCEVAVAVAGIAGGGGATSTAPPGLCFWALSHPGGTVVEDGQFTGSPEQVQQQAAHAVLDLVRRTLKA